MLWLVRIAFTGVPLLMVFLSLRQLVTVWHLRRFGKPVTGRVVQQRKWQSRGNISFSPTVEFTTQTAEAITVENESARSPAEFTDGQLVLIYYDPKQPARFLLAEQLTKREVIGLTVSAIITITIAVLFCRGAWQ